MAKDLYESLGVKKGATADEIKSAYRRMAKQYHPDQNPNNKEAEAKFKEINAAYEVLSDPAKKQNYDRFGSAEGMGGMGGGFGGGGFGGGGGFADLGDLFGSIFGGMGGEGGGFGDFFGMGGGTGARSRGGRARGNDVHVSINLTFKEACLGTKKTVSFSRFEKCSTCGGTGAKSASDVQTCPVCQGAGRVRETSRFGHMRFENVVPCSACNATGKQIRDKCTACGGKGSQKRNVQYEVNVPAGIHDGQTINISGEGEVPAQGEGSAGNLLIAVHVAAHPLLVREEFDLFLDLPISFTQAILGDKVEIPAVDGVIEFQIPPHTQSGAVHRLKGRGVKRLRGIGSGDLVVKINVETPKSLDRKQLDIIRQLDESISRHEYPKRKTFREKMERV